MGWTPKPQLVNYVAGVPAAVDFVVTSDGAYPICINQNTGDLYVLIGNTITPIVRNTASVTLTSPATYTVAAIDQAIIANRAGTITLTLPSASAYKGRWLTVRTIQAQTVVSNASNVVPLAGGGAGTAILSATAGKWARLLSDGTNWQIMEAN